MVKYRNKLLLVVVIVPGLSYLIWWAFFAPVNEWSSNYAEITIFKAETKKHEAIYPTRLISVDLEKHEAYLEVKFPEDGWKKFIGKEGKPVEEIGYHILEVNKESITIGVTYPNITRGRLRWK